jgi:hypothetical protein
VWRAIERCMAVLEQVPVAEQETRARELAALARLCFDCTVSDPAERTAEERRRLADLRDTALRCLAPALLRGEEPGAIRRIEQALTRAGAPAAI